MPTTSAAQLRAVKKYQMKKARIVYSVSKEKKADIQNFAKDHGTNVNTVIDKAVDHIMANPDVLEKSLDKTIDHIIDNPDVLNS